jgi:regulator of sigma E protease
LETVLYALLIVPILTFLIFVHELGHYMAARRADMKVEEFGFGLPPRIWGFRRGETLWSINAIPLGGFVRVLGEDGKNFDPRSMQAKTVGQRALFITAGSLMNFLTAFVLIAVLLASEGEPQSNAYIVGVQPETPAAVAGWQAGDRFVEVDGRSVDNAVEIVDITNANLGEEMSVVLDRNGELVESSIVPRESPPAGQGPTGIRLDDAMLATLEVYEIEEGSAAAAAGLQPGDIVVESAGQTVTDYLTYHVPLLDHAGETVEIVVQRDGELLSLPVNVPADIADSEPLGMSLVEDVHFERTPVLQIVPKTFEQFFGWIERMFDGLMLMIRGEIPLSDVAGPIGMGQLTSEIVTRSALPLWVTILNLTILLSLNLAILNLLPLPALDGGRLAFVILEVLRRGRRIAPEKEGIVHFVGLVILLTFMFAVAFMDIDRIISGNSLLQ